MSEEGNKVEIGNRGSSANHQSIIPLAIWPSPFSPINPEKIPGSKKSMRKQSVNDKMISLQHFLWILNFDEDQLFN
jgi:hypothetical protein